MSSRKSVPLLGTIGQDSTGGRESTLTITSEEERESSVGEPSKSVRRSRHASLSVRTAEEKQAAGDGGAS